MKKILLTLLITLFTFSANAQRKVETTYLKLKSVKNARVLGTDKKGYIIDKTLDLADVFSTPTYKAGTNIVIDKTDPLKPIINVANLKEIDIQPGANIIIDKTNPLKPIINARGGIPTINEVLKAGNIATEATNMGFLDPNPMWKASTSIGQYGVISEFGYKNVRSEFNSEFILFKNLKTGGTLKINHPKDNINTSANLQVNIRHKAGTLALTNDIPNYKSGTNITIDNTNPLAPIISAVSGGTSTTNLTYTQAINNGLVNSSTGTNATIPLANKDYAGLMPPNFYEEGTFEPVLEERVTATEVAATYNYKSKGMYTRVGNLIHFSIRFEKINSTGTPKGSLFISGIPFFQVSDPFQFHYPFYSLGEISGINKNAHRINLKRNGSGDMIVMGHTEENTKGAALTKVTFNNGTLIFSGTYRSGASVGGVVINRTK